MQSYDQLVDLIVTTNPTYRTYNEILLENQPCKLVFDLEWCDYKSTTNEDQKYPDALRITIPQFSAEQTMDVFKQQLFLTAQETFGKPMDESNLLILNSSRPIEIEVEETGVKRQYYKNSFHVYVINYGFLPNLHEFHKRLTQILLNRIQDMPILSKRLGITCSHQEKVSAVIDDNVYKKNQSFRAVLCTKFGKNSYFRPSDKDTNQPIHQFFSGWLTENDHPLDITKLNVIHIEKKIFPETQNPWGKTDMKQTSYPSPPPHLETYVSQSLNHLCPRRIQGYQKWFEVACILYSIHPGLLNVFDLWSQKASNYQVGACQKLWNGLYQSNYNLNHLLQLVTLDQNPDVSLIEPLITKVGLDVTRCGLHIEDLVGLDLDDLKRLKKMTSTTTPTSRINLKHVHLQMQAKHGSHTPSLMETHLGYRWSYLHQNCPRDPLEEAKKNNFWGASVRINQEDTFVSLDPFDLIHEVFEPNAKYDTIVIKAPCGGAKTDFVVKLITQLVFKSLLPTPGNFLILSALRTLAYSLQSRFMGQKKPYGWKAPDPDPNLVNLQLYSNIKTYDQLIDQNINMVINSLPKLAAFGTDLDLSNHLRSLILIDEFKSFLLNLPSSTLSNHRRQIMSHLEYYMKNAPFCIVMDQNIDDDCLTSLFQVRDPKKTIFFDFQKPNCCDQTIYELNDINKMIEILDQQYLSQNKLVYICSNSKTHGVDLITAYIKLKYPDYQLRIYTSDTPDEDKLSIGECEEDWVCSVIASPALSYGMDYSKKGVYSAIFCFITKSYSVPASILCQQMRRVRFTIDNKIFICNQSISRYEHNTWASIDDQIIQRLTRNPKDIREEPPTKRSTMDRFPCCLCSGDGVSDVVVGMGKPVGTEVVGENDESDKKNSQFGTLNTAVKTNLVTETKKIQPSQSNGELYAMLIKSKLDQNGSPRLKNSWFTQIYRCYYRTELESRQNMINWVRGIMCANGYKYLVLNSDSLQDPDMKEEIQLELTQSETLRLEHQTQQYLDAPIVKESPNQISEAKYYHCQLFGLKDIDKAFYQTWIDDQSFRKMTNLITYLSDSTDRVQQHYNQKDFLLTEKNVASCLLLKQLLEVSGLDLNGYFFTGLSPIQLEIGNILPDQVSFLNRNKKDLLCHFGGVGRIRGEMKTSYHLNKYVSRILASYLGIDFECQRVQVRKGQEREYQAIYSIVIPDQIYELLTYRLLSVWNKRKKWILPLDVCRQLRNKYRKINQCWDHLAICTEWPDVPELGSLSHKETSKIKLKLKSKETSNTKINVNTSEVDFSPPTTEDQLDHFNQCLL